MRILYWAALLLLVGQWLGHSVDADPRMWTQFGAFSGIRNWNASTQTCGEEHSAGGAEETDVVYSVIVVSYNNARGSNLFQDRERLCAFSSGTVLVQIADPFVRKSLESPSDSPFFVDHSPSVKNRVRILDMHGARGHQVRYRAILRHYLGSIYATLCTSFGRFMSINNAVQSSLTA